MVQETVSCRHAFGSRLVVILVVAGAFVGSGEGRDATGLQDRMIDWSHTGVWVKGVKGIPDYPVRVTCGPPAYKVYPDEMTDSGAGIQAAINACPPGSTVYLPKGAYRVGGRVGLKSGVSLRGAGPGLTTILLTDKGAGFVAASPNRDLNALVTDQGPGPDPNNMSGPIVAGYTKGSTTIVVSSALAANLLEGNLVLINELNDPEFVTTKGYGGACNWAGGSGQRALGEVKMIASKSGTSITFTRPLYHGYRSPLGPKLIRMSSAGSVVRNAGIENLTIDGNAVAAACVEFLAAAHCWVKGVEFKNWFSHSIRLTWGALGCEVAHCYLHDPVGFAGNQGYGIAITGNATDNSIYDSIFKWVHVGVSIGSAGGTANVVAYNYCHSTNHRQPNWPIPGFATHGGHTLLNLFEGNVNGRMLFDGYWGSGSHNVAFRNWLTGDNNNPSVTMNKICVEVETMNPYVSYVGNVLGFSGMTGEYEIGVDGVRDTQRGGYYIWKVGFAGSDQFGQRHAPTVESLIRHGNYDYITQTIRWDPAIRDHDLPPSYYLSAKPSWFGSLDWPPFGPDVPGYVKTTPAKLRWDTYAGSGRLSDLF
jgi:hypothetical protein